LAIGPDTMPPVTRAASLTMAENAVATKIGIAASTDPNYSASQLTVTLTELPTDGTVLLSDGATAVTEGEILTVAQLMGLMVKPTAGVSGESSSFAYSVSDPSGNKALGTATLALGPDKMPPPTMAASLTVAGSAAATAIGIASPTDPNYAASQLTVTVPGCRPAARCCVGRGHRGHQLRGPDVAQLTGLMFKPAAGAFGVSSSFAYSVADPSGNKATWAATLAFGPATMRPSTTAASLTVAENAAATTIGIAAPSDPNYAASRACFRPLRE
jgi:hypothetical protein